MPGRRLARDATGRTVPVAVPAEARAAATASRRAGATSSPNRAIVRGVVAAEDERARCRPRGRAGAGRRPTARAAPGGSRRPRTTRRRGSAGDGSRAGRGRPPAPTRRSGRSPRPGRRPSGSRGSAASRRPCAPRGRASAACTRRARSGCRGRATGRAWRRRPGGASRGPAAGRRSFVSQMPRMMSIASSSASTPCPGVRRGAPMATIASQNAPEPRPSANRPPESRSRLAAARARTAGGRSGQVEHVAGDLDAVRRRGDPGEQGPRVEERRLVRVVLERHEVQPGPLGGLRQGDDLLRVLRGRRQEGAEHEVVAVVGHARSPSMVDASTIAPPSMSAQRGTIVRGEQHGPPRRST